MLVGRGISIKICLPCTTSCNPNAGSTLLSSCEPAAHRISCRIFLRYLSLSYEGMELLERWGHSEKEIDVDQEICSTAQPPLLGQGYAGFSIENSASWKTLSWYAKVLVLGNGEV